MAWTFALPSFSLSLIIFLLRYIFLAFIIFLCCFIFPHFILLTFIISSFIIVYRCRILRTRCSLDLQMFEIQGLTGPVLLSDWILEMQSSDPDITFSFRLAGFGFLCRLILYNCRLIPVDWLVLGPDPRNPSPWIRDPNMHHDMCVALLIILDPSFLIL